MIFDVNNLNPGVWFDKEDMKIKLRLCAGDDLRKIDKQTTKKQVEYKRGQRFEYVDINEDLRNEVIWDFCIVEWKNVMDKHGNEIPCTRANKVLLMGQSIAFASFVGDCLEKLTKDEEKRIEEEHENLSSTQGG